VPKKKIDILQMELDQKLPHWLDPRQRYSDKYDAILEQARQEWIDSLDQTPPPSKGE